MSGVDAADHTEKVFRDYLERMPPGIGKRFLLIHLNDHGLKAVETFWDKMRLAFAKDQKTFEFSPEEKSSLAKALALSCWTRRRWLGWAAGVVTAGKGLHGVIDAFVELALRENETLWQRAKNYLNFAGKFGGWAVVGLAGVGVTSITEGWYDHKLSELVHDKQGEQNMYILVQALNTMFLPIEAAIAESGAMQDKRVHHR